MYYTTLKAVRACRPCLHGWIKLLRHLDKIGPDDEPLSILTILESNGIEDAIWALRAVDDPACKRDGRLFAVRCVRQVQHLISDTRTLYAVDVAERWAAGLSTDKELHAAVISAPKVIAWVAQVNLADPGDMRYVLDAARHAARIAWVDAGDKAWATAWEATKIDFQAIFCDE